MAVLPALGPVTQGFSQEHQAIDIANVVGTPIHAPDGGRITHAGQMGIPGTRDDAGLTVQIQTLDNRVVHRLGHNNSILVKVGDIVKKGQVVAYMGFTGYTVPDDNPSSSHTHWVMFLDGVRVNGLLYIDKETKVMITRRGVDTLARFYMGRDASTHEVNKFVGKWTFDDTANAYAAAPEYTKIVAAHKGAVKGVKPTIMSHLPLKMRT